MRAKIEPLPSDLETLGPNELKQAIAARDERIDELFADVKLDSRVVEEAAKLNDELEQLRKVAGSMPGHLYSHPGHPPMPGSLTSSPTREWKNGHWSGSFLQQVKALTPSGSVMVPRLSAGIVRMEDRPRSILDVVPVTPLTGTDQYSYLRETARTNNAAPVVVSGTAIASKPTSVYSVEREDDTVTTIAHLSQQIPRHTLSDAALLQTYLEGSLREGVMETLETQIVNGDGTGVELLGFAEDPARNTSVTWSSDLLTTSRKALTELEAVNIRGGVYVFSPLTWETIELLAEADGALLLGGPVDRPARRLWGKSVVVSAAVDDAVAFLVDFDGSTMLWERESVRVDWSENIYDPTAVATDFERNLIRFRAEGRFGWAVLRGDGVVEFPTSA